MWSSYWQPFIYSALGCQQKVLEVWSYRYIRPYYLPFSFTHLFLLVNMGFLDVFTSSQSQEVGPPITNLHKQHISNNVFTVLRLWCAPPSQLKSRAPRRCRRVRGEPNLSLPRKDLTLNCRLQRRMKITVRGTGSPTTMLWPRNLCRSSQMCFLFIIFTSI